MCRCEQWWRGPDTRFPSEKRPKTEKNRKKPKKPVETRAFAVDKAAQKPQG
jgi:hypothetical protein